MLVNRAVFFVCQLLQGFQSSAWLYRIMTLIEKDELMVVVGGFRKLKNSFALRYLGDNAVS